MRGFDGNYINTQGDASAKLQLAYQIEQNRQQVRAQLEATDTLRKLREQVNETEKKDASGGPAEVKDDRGSRSNHFEKNDGSSDEDSRREDQSMDKQRLAPIFQSHIDIRV